MDLRRATLVVLAVVIATCLGACSLLPFGADDATSAPPPPPPPPGAATAAAGTETVAADEATAAEASGDMAATDDAATTETTDEAAQAEEDTGPVEPQALSGGDAGVFASGAYLVNVDKPANYRIEHIDGAVNVPLGDLAVASAGWDKDGAIMLTGRKTGLARSGARYLSEQGFTNVAYLDGGHNAWSGWYEGFDERDPQTRAKLFFIYSGDPRLLINADSVLNRQWAAFSKQVSEDYRALEDSFSQDIDMELVDVSASAASTNRALEILREYDVPVSTSEGTAGRYLIPNWILVDKNGRVTFGWGVPDARSTLARAYGWMVQESMRDTVHEQRSDHPVQGANFVWLDQTPWVRPDH